MEILLNNYKLPQEELQKLIPNRTWLAIIKTCFVLGLDDRPKGWNLWSNEEIRKIYNSKSLDELYELLPNRTKTMIKGKCSELGVYFERWEEWEDEYLKNNYLDSDWSDILPSLKNRNKEAVYMRANKLGLHRAMGRIDILDEDIIKMYNDGNHRAKISKTLNISIGAITYRLKRNGIKAKMKIYKGEEHHCWKGNSDELKRLRGVSEYYKWRIDVFRRDGFVCQKCFDSTGGNLEAHHIKNFSSFPEGRYDVDNGITLCKYCHTVGKKSFHSVYSTKGNTVEQLEDFLAESI